MRSLLSDGLDTHALHGKTDKDFENFIPEVLSDWAERNKDGT